MKRMSRTNEIIITLIVGLMATLPVPLSRCHHEKFTRNFYVQDLDLHIDIEGRDSVGLNDYRIYIYRSKEQKGQDYVDVQYSSYDLPCITFCFPLETTNDINIIDRKYGYVKDFHSTNFNFVNKDYINKDYNSLTDTDEERIAYRAWKDSVMYGSPNIRVRVDSYLISISLWDNYDTYLGTIWQPEFKDIW